MKIPPFGFSRVLALVLLILQPPAELQAAKGKGKAQGTPPPSAHLRPLMDKTLASLPVLLGKGPGNRPAIVEAQANWTALAQTAPAADQPMYAAAANVAQMLLAAQDEREKAAANYRYSNNVHGAQDKKDAQISNPTRGWDAGALARADNAKQNKENADSRKALLDKEKFMNKGAVDEWKVRSEQIRTAVEQAYTAELVTEKQVLMARAATPAPAPPPPRPPVSPKTETSAAEAYSPVGKWTAPKGQWTLGEDGSFTMATGAKGKWKWSDQSKRELGLTYPNGGEGKGVFSQDGKSLEVTNPKGGNLTLTR